MEWFLEIFQASIEGLEIKEEKNIKKRVELLIDEFRKNLYDNVCRSLFTKHKLLFSFSMTIKILSEQEQLNTTELNFLLTGLTNKNYNTLSNPLPKKISEKSWDQICDMSTNLPTFTTLSSEISRKASDWEEYISNNETTFPSPYTDLDTFPSLLLTKILKPEKLITTLHTFISTTLGSYFRKPSPTSLEQVFKQSSYKKPIILILTPGNDPLAELNKFSDQYSQYILPFSLGQGQGGKAETLITETKNHGKWCLLQNCHLAGEWLNQLEKIIEQISFLPKGAVDSRFRIWLTSKSCQNFPVSILRNGVKLTSEPPSGVKDNLARVFNNVAESRGETVWFNSCAKMEEWRKLFMGLAFFHSIVRERRKFGALGWNNSYDFNDSDFKISKMQLHSMLSKSEEIPFKALLYLTGECNYGGRVTDDWDRRTLNHLLTDFYHENNLFYKTYFSGLKDYYIPQLTDFNQYISYIKQLPDDESPELFGLHQNADMIYVKNEGKQILMNILEMSGINAVSKERDEDDEDEHYTIKEITSKLRVNLPLQFNIRSVKKIYGTLYEESMNTVLIQELTRYNNLLGQMNTSLKTVTKTIDGLIMITPEIEELIDSLLKNKVPKLWSKLSYPSLKPFSSWFTDLNKRIEQLQNWINDGQPHSYWISGFFFTQSFLTGN